MSTDIETFTPFDAANYLNTVEDVAAYLEGVIDEADDDPTVIARALGSIARSRNFSQIARQGTVRRRQPQPCHRRQGVARPRTPAALRSHRLTDRTRQSPVRRSRSLAGRSLGSCGDAGRVPGGLAASPHEVR